MCIGDVAAAYMNRLVQISYQMCEPTQRRDLFESRPPARTLERIETQKDRLDDVVRPGEFGEACAVIAGETQRKIDVVPRAEALVASIGEEPLRRWIRRR